MFESVAWFKFGNNPFKADKCSLTESFYLLDLSMTGRCLFLLTVEGHSLDLIRQINKKSKLVTEPIKF